MSSQYASTLLNKPHNTRTPKTLRDLLVGAPPDAIDLLEKLMVFNPDKRLTAEQALRHPYVARCVVACGGVLDCGSVVMPGGCGDV